MTHTKTARPACSLDIHWLARTPFLLANSRQRAAHGRTEANPEPEVVRCSFHRDGAFGQSFRSLPLCIIIRVETLAKTSRSIPIYPVAAGHRTIMLVIPCDPKRSEDVVCAETAISRRNVFRASAISRFTMQERRMQVDDQKITEANVHLMSAAHSASEFYADLRLVTPNLMHILTTSSHGLAGGLVSRSLPLREDRCNQHYLYKCSLAIAY